MSDATSATSEQWVTSADGTQICVTVSGGGPPLVICPGALAAAQDWQLLSSALASRMTVYAVDRRGHGASGDGPSYSIEREQEDVTAVLALAGQDAILLGHSYGGLVALGLALGQPPARLVLYEPPIPLDGPIGGAALRLYEAAVRQGDLDDALALGLQEFLRLPLEAITAFRQQPIWPRLAAMAPSWTREVRGIDQFGDDLDRFGAITVLVLLLVGGASPPWLTGISRRLARVLPDVTLAEIPGQGHDAHIFDPKGMTDKITELSH